MTRPSPTAETFVRWALRGMGFTDDEIDGLTWDEQVTFVRCDAEMWEAEHGPVRRHDG